MIRDGRAVALSLRAMPWWPDSLVAGAEAWLDAIRLSDAMSAEYPQRFLTVRYEELVERPEEMLDSVMKFLHLRFQPAQLKPGTSGVVLARSAAWKGLALGSIDPTRVHDWRSKASAVELDYLNQALGSVLRRLKYCL
jgi:Sulfotransferase family